MKIEQLIVQYLYNNKVVTLQNIGTFEISPNVNLPLDSDKDITLPENSIIFKYNAKAGQDEGLIDFIVSHSRKIKPLATSDLESYSITGKEYINIGKPFPIAGLGVLEKSGTGEYVFVQGVSVNPKLKEVSEHITEKRDEEIVFSTPARKSNTVRNLSIGIGVLILLILIPAAIYYFYGDVGSTNITQQINTNSADFKKDSQVNIIEAPPVAAILSDTSFMVVIKKFTSKIAAENQLKKYDPANKSFIIFEKDSANFYLGLKVPSAKMDSTRIMDSVNRFYAVKSFMEYINKQ